MLKPQSNGVIGTGKLAVEDPQALKDQPNLRGFFLNQTYDDGTTDREAGVLIIKPTGDGWSFTVKDPSAAVMMRVCGRTWAETWVLVESLLGNAKAPWEVDPFELGKRKRGRGRYGR
jgi:hypothetical protein